MDREYTKEPRSFLAIYCVINERAIHTQRSNVFSLLITLLPSRSSSHGLLQRLYTMHALVDRDCTLYSWHVGQKQLLSTVRSTV